MKTIINNPKKFKRVEIEWIDSMSPAEGGWIYLETDKLNDKYVSACYSCGYLIGENEEEYKICCSYHERSEDSLNFIGLIGIPKVSVLAFKVIKTKV